MESGPVRTLVRLMLTNRLSMAYLGLVAVVIAKAAVDSAHADEHGSEYAWLWPPLVTFPVYPLLSALGRTAWRPDTPNWFFIGTVVASALLQSLALGALRQAVLARHRRSLRSC
ncbi:SCO4225 family membrane protein [Streptomyces fuscichromogenes]|uniref:SCO4225 family membrane protein n=1 Tax=Streptomyces fuscichromogenes TaxID=1324013 RepID=UPI0038249E7B